MCLMATLPVFAGNDNIEYEFILKADYGNSYSDPRMRTSTTPSNAWKVNMTYSSEGGGTQATYWLARYDNKAVASGRHTIKQGSGAHYYHATNMANNTKVQLAGENNNKTSKTYLVKGYWDEETTVYL